MWHVIFESARGSAEVEATPSFRAEVATAGAAAFAAAPWPAGLVAQPQARIVVSPVNAMTGWGVFMIVFARLVRSLES